ncbi:Protein lethal(2)essential for life [Strongyloides ratti]|uniref:Protein lethal(2)essential for life n=1 Tax=Strongyloides ratti TaxID=34506 RepID=A0A090N0C6_STRRB|nr:Protein lethal(2)essential for life [Strongyloides ratti]CEF70452.1 Protein lethal(2)essential for life [Strongyloides ratti]
MYPFFNVNGYSNDSSYRNHLIEKETVHFTFSNIQPYEIPKLIESCPEIINNDKEFKIEMDVSLFSSDDLKVTIKDKFLQVDGYHKEKNDNYGTIQRSFTRKYLLPSDVDTENIVSKLTNDGVLTIEAKAANVSFGTTFEFHECF